MGVYTFTIVDETSSVAPSRLFKAMCLDNHNLMPKVAPQFFGSIDLIEGDSTVVGCVKQTNFVGEGNPYKYVKAKVDELDVENHYVKFTTFEGDTLGNTLECIVYEAKIESTGSGSQYILVGHHHSKGDIVVTEDDVKYALQGMLKTYQAVVEYLNNNPQVYA